jgi:hypothetical protein
MIVKLKPIESLTVADLAADPIWEYTNRDGPGETFVRAIKKTPVQTLRGRVIGTQVRLANGTQVWALIGNIEVKNPRLTEHFLTLSVEHAGKWFDLARYHDYDYSDRGPEALSRFLGLKIDDVFPLQFDVRRHAHGDPTALANSILKDPRERLSRSDIVALAVP